MYKKRQHYTIQYRFITEISLSEDGYFIYTSVYTSVLLFILDKSEIFERLIFLIKIKIILKEMYNCI
jgi:hypothetical protein